MEDERDQGVAPVAPFPLLLLAAEILVISSYPEQSVGSELQRRPAAAPQGSTISHLYLDTKRQPHQDPERLVSQGMAAYQAASRRW